VNLKQRLKVNLKQRLKVSSIFDHLLRPIYSPLPDVRREAGRLRVKLSRPARWSVVGSLWGVSTATSG